MRASCSERGASSLVLGAVVMDVASLDEYAPFNW
jgi:hypothetical protein